MATTIAIGMTGTQLVNALNELSNNITVNGDSQLKIGLSAGAALTAPATNCLAIGYIALSSDTTGYENLAIGNQSLRDNVSGNNNIAIGYLAMRTGTSPDQNICIGYRAGYAMESNSNIAIGSQSQEATSGNCNISIGGGALRYNTGYDNCAFGSGSLPANTSGYANCGFGTDTLYSNIGGNRNVGVGHQSGYTNISGVLNVFIGYQAGYYETGSNKLFIDNTARASEADARIKALVYGIFDADPVNQLLTINGVLKLTPLAAPPSGAEGMVYMDTDHHLYVYNASTWVQLDN